VPRSMPMIFELVVMMLIPSFCAPWSANSAF